MTTINHIITSQESLGQIFIEINKFMNDNKGKKIKCDFSVITEAKAKSIEAHNYFIGVVCPCVAHACVGAGYLSKAQFKEFTIDDCIDLVKQMFFRKERIGKNTWKYHSLKMSKWTKDGWNNKIQSIIDTVLNNFKYQIPESDKAHSTGFLERLKNEN